RLGAESPLRPRAGKAGQDDDPQRVRHEDERHVDRVRGEETVRLHTMAELAREDRTCHGSRAADRGGGDPGEDPATHRAPAWLWTTLHRCRATIASSGARPSSTSCGATSPTCTRGAPVS